jgi:hypothetical protein
MWLEQGALCLEIPKEGFTEKDRFEKSRILEENIKGLFRLFLETAPPCGWDKEYHVSRS